MLSAQVKKKRIPSQKKCINYSTVIKKKRKKKVSAKMSLKPFKFHRAFSRAHK